VLLLVGYSAPQKFRLVILSVENFLLVFSSVDQSCHNIYGGSGSVRSSHQTVSDYTLLSMISRQPTPLPSSAAVLRRLEKFVLSLIFDKSLSALTMWNLQSYSTTVLNERMLTFYRVKTYSDPSYILSGGQDFQLPGATPPLVLSAKFVQLSLSSKGGNSSKIPESASRCGSPP